MAEPTLLYVAVKLPSGRCSDWHQACMDMPRVLHGTQSAMPVLSCRQGLPSSVQVAEANPHESQSLHGASPTASGEPHRRTAARPSTDATLGLVELRTQLFPTKKNRCPGWTTSGRTRTPTGCRPEETAQQHQAALRTDQLAIDLRGRRVRDERLSRPSTDPS